MAEEKRCMGCMKPLNEFSGDLCVHCGYPVNGENPAEYLPVRTPLSDRYVVGRVWEARGDSVVYLGYDRVMKNKIFLREFFPSEICVRAESGSVTPKEGSESAFVGYLQEFRAHAKALARMRELPVLLPIYDIFDQNDTVYTVSEFCDKQSLRQYMDEIRTYLPWDQVRPLFVPLMGSVMALHNAGVYHLGISPDTVMLADDGKLRLDGWQMESTRLTGEGLKPQLTAGYAAPEQYQSGEQAQAAMDVYGLSATILYTLTATEPPLSTDRVEKQAKLLIPASIANQWPTYLPMALNDGLKTVAARRIATVEQLRERLTSGPVVDSLKTDVPTTPADKKPAEAEPVKKAPPAKAAPKKPEQPRPEQPRPDVKKANSFQPGRDTKSLKGEFASKAIKDEAMEPPKRSNKGLIAAVSILSALCLLLVGTVGFMAFQPSTGGGANTPTTTTTLTVPTASQPQYSVEDLTGMVYTEVADHLFNGDMPVKMQYRVFNDLPKGQIVSQTPTPESMAVYGTTIEVVVSDGPEKKPLPNLAGWESYAAQQYLESLGYRVQMQQINVSTYERGRVQETNPPADTALAEGSLVILMVSNMTTTRPAAAATTTTTVQR